MPKTSARTPSPAITVVVQAGPTGRPAYYAMWRRHRPDGTVQLNKRKVGAAWLDSADDGTWKKRRGRVADGFLDERGATVAADALVHDIESQLAEEADAAAARYHEDATFREVATEFLEHRREVKGTRPSTLLWYARMLAEPGTPHRRGVQRDADGNVIRNAEGHPVRSVSDGWIMKRIGDKRAADVTTRDIEVILHDVAKAGRSATTVNNYRALLSSVFGYASRPSTYGLAINPAKTADRRRQPPTADIEFYSVEDIEALARAMAAGTHRGAQYDRLSPDEVTQRKLDDEQDAELIRVAGYTGLRRSELIALRWRDVDFATRQIHVRRTLSAGIEVDAPKSGKRRSVPMTDRALGALDRLSQRADFTSPDDHVAVGATGRRIDPDTFGKRVSKAQKSAGMRHIALHGLRHSFASQLVAAGLGLADVQKALGHSKIETTSRYLHARPVHELADAFSRAQAGPTADPALRASEAGQT